MDLWFDNHRGFLFVPLAEALSPCFVTVGIEQCGYGRQGFFAITQYSDVYGDIFVDFGGVNVEVYFTGLLGIGGKLAGNAVVETHTHSNE